MLHTFKGDISQLLSLCKTFVFLVHDNKLFFYKSKNIIWNIENTNKHVRVKRIYNIIL